MEEYKFKGKKTLNKTNPLTFFYARQIGFHRLRSYMGYVMIINDNQVFRPCSHMHKIGHSDASPNIDFLKTQPSYISQTMLSTVSLFTSSSHTRSFGECVVSTSRDITSACRIIAPKHYSNNYGLFGHYQVVKLASNIKITVNDCDSNQFDGQHVLYKGKFQ